jgi:8-oxo-dGTP pyrophosphatase MutT (NUDIX family)
VAAVSRYTWDGLPVAPDEPHGAAILARRSGEYLLLHRAHRGPGYQGDWAWTPPSGSRQPGEAVLAAALRELAEETGIQARAADLRALDLSGGWAHFGFDVPANVQPRLDAEHDRFEWLPATRAIARCKPAAVADGIRLAESSSCAELTFRPLAETQHAAVVNGRDVGMLRHYPVTDDEPAVVDLPASVGIAFGTLDSGFADGGLGPQLIWSYLRDVVLAAHPGVRRVVASPDIDAVRLIRALLTAGFTSAGEITAPGKAGPKLLCILDRRKFFG